MHDLLVWVYILNSVLLIVHEIDSAYWQEWKLFKLPGGLAFFLCLHIPLAFVVLYGLLLVYQNVFAGLIISLVLGLAGVFAFSIHTFFIRRGYTEFKIPVSMAILVATLVLSLVQLVLTAWLLFAV
ncbi:MAG: hypothetical protein EHM12_04130 [Dehalococcoidia bacterium]|nr:MAG: hypothetical protein EHM12_04130 [Dehalococcoidia bacterium]